MRLPYLCAVALAAAALSACSSDKSTSPNTQPTTVVVPTSLSLVAGQDTTLAAKVENSSGDSLSAYTVTYASADTTIVKIASNGTIMPVGPGTTTITAMAVNADGTLVSGVNAVITVTVAEPTAARIVLTGAPDSIAVGDSARLSAVVLSSTGDTLRAAAVSWLSSDTTLATVSDSGEVHAMAIGSPVISASLATVSASDTLHVVAAASPSVAARRRRSH